MRPAVSAANEIVSRCAERHDAQGTAAIAAFDRDDGVADASSAGRRPAPFDPDQRSDMLTGTPINLLPPTSRAPSSNLVVRGPGDVVRSLALSRAWRAGFSRASAPNERHDGARAHGAVKSAPTTAPWCLTPDVRLGTMWR
jgi:hypothetical protein